MVVQHEIRKLYNATDNLVNQQFYEGGNDTIIGRTPKVSVKIKQSGQIIKKFKDLFNQNLNSFLEGNYLNFLRSFKKIKGLNDDNIKEIYDELKEKLEVLRENAADEEIVISYTIVLSGIISKIRDLHFNNSIAEVKKRIKGKSNAISDNDIQKELNNLFMRNNDNISLLYNLSYLDALASSFNYSKVARVCKIQKGKYINRIVKIILSNANN
jgi:hypothetical protein